MLEKLRNIRFSELQKIWESGEIHRMPPADFNEFIKEIEKCQNQMRQM